MTAPFVLLLVEHTDLDEEDSLVPKLQGDTHDLLVAHTLEETIELSQINWPNLIVTNVKKSPLNPVELRHALDEVKLDTPCLVFGDGEKLDLDLMSANITPVLNGRLPELAQVITQVIGKQRNRYIRTNNMILDCERARLINDRDEQHSLTPKEFKLLELLMRHRGQILSRREIMMYVWNTDYLGDTRTLDVHIRWIRQKIEEVPSRPIYLKTIRGEGYILVTDPQKLA